MADFLEVWKTEGMGLVALEAGRVAVGKAETNDVCISDDPTVSGLHAVLERYGPGWCVKDLGSTNGTFVNSERVTAERVLKTGDEIRVGQTRLVYRTGAGAARPVTQMAEKPPEVGGDERSVLLALCRPVLSGDMFTEPATAAEVAKELGFDQAAVEAHFETLYKTFNVEGEGDKRRLKLANEAVRRGAVSIADLRS